MKGRLITAQYIDRLSVSGLEKVLGWYYNGFCFYTLYSFYSAKFMANRETDTAAIVRQTHTYRIGTRTSL